MSLLKPYSKTLKFFATVETKNLEVISKKIKIELIMNKKIFLKNQIRNFF